MDMAGEMFVTSGEVRLWTQRFGDPGDPAVLLIMGTSAQGIGWPDELIEVLVAGGRQVIRYDHRDTGRSTCVDFAARPYALADMAADAVAVLDGHHVPAAHVAGASLGGAITQWLAVHRPARVLSLTVIMSGPLGHDAGPAWARALTGQAPDPGDLPPPSPRFLRHLAERTAMPQTIREQQITAGLETWRVPTGSHRCRGSPRQRSSSTAPKTPSAHCRTVRPSPRRSPTRSWKQSPAWDTDSFPQGCPATSASSSLNTPDHRRQASYQGALVPSRST